MISKVIVIAGMPGSGKSIIAEAAKELGLSVLSMGDVLRKEAKRRGLPLTDRVLGKLAISLRENFGKDYVAKALMDDIRRSKSKIVIIEGVRNLEEINFMRRKAGKVIILSVHASPSTRYVRLLKRGRGDDPKTWDEFKERDKRELEIGIGNVIALSDRILINEDISRVEFKKKCLEELRRVIDDC